MQAVYHVSFKAMGSPCQLQFYAASSGQAKLVENLVVQRIVELENRYSRYRSDSLITKINRAAGSGVRTTIDAETFALLQYSEQCYQESEGLFDVTSGVLRHIWHFEAEASLPNTKVIQQLLSLVGWDKVQWDAQSICLPLAGMALDFGGIVKEYAADVAVGICRQHGIQAGIIELGGDIAIIGAQANGIGWPVAIRDPRKPAEIVAQHNLTQGALASSGDYERFSIIKGVRYSHILNPKTGWPVQGLRAVSIKADHCVLAGSLATIAMLKGKDGLAWLQSLGMPFVCCLANGKIINQLTIDSH